MGTEDGAPDLVLLSTPEEPRVEVDASPEDPRILVVNPYDDETLRVVARALKGMAEREPQRVPARFVVFGAPSPLTMAVIALGNGSSIIDHPPPGLDELEEMRRIIRSTEADTIRREPVERDDPFFDFSLSYLVGRHRPRRQRHITLDSYVWHRLEPAPPKDRDKKRQAEISKARKKRRAKGRR